MRDEVIEEIREQRKKMLQKEFGGSLERFSEHAKQWQREHPERVVNLHNRKATERKARLG
jgi:hypothetical protein